MKDAQTPIADATRAIAACLETLDATLAKLEVAYRERGDEEYYLAQLRQYERQKPRHRRK